MENQNKNRLNIKILNFSSTYQPPRYKYNKKLNLIEWGDKNEYPKYLLNLYNSSSTRHKAIINKKTKLIAGKGFEEVLDPSLDAFIKQNKLVAETKKAALDYEIFNGFAFEIIWTNDGSAISSIQHIPMHKLRIGIENEELNFEHLWFSNDWSQYKKEEYEPEMIRTFNPKVKQGKQIYFYCEYNPEQDGLYPIPGYSSEEYMNYVELASDISKFHLNQSKQGYAPSFILNFSTGIPTEEEQDTFHKEFKRNYQGADNAGKIILTYSEGVDQKPELIPIQLSDSDERFIALKDQIEEQIVAGAEIPPQLVILTPGKLGSTDERKELMQEFQEFYVTPRQENIEAVLNEILSTGGYKEEIKLQQYNTL